MTSFVSVRAYFQDVMRAVDPSLKEWQDAFSIDNIPSTILDYAWHFALNPFSYSGTAHTCLTFRCPVTLSVCLKGYRAPKDAVDTAARLADSIVREATRPVRRLNQPQIKNVLPSTISIRELGQTNDNVVVLEIQFICTVIV
jgi:hypothetical protein